VSVTLITTVKRLIVQGPALCIYIEYDGSKDYTSVGIYGLYKRHFA